MNRDLHRVLSCGLLLLLAVVKPLMAEDAGTGASSQSPLPALKYPPTRESEADVRTIIAHLDDNDAATRQHAALLLINCSGGAAEPLVQAAINLPQTSARMKEGLKAAELVLAPRAKIELQEDQYFQWVRQLLLDSYLHGPHTNAKWDELAKPAIGQYVTLLSEKTKPPGEQLVVLHALSKARTAGCDDPLVGYLCARAAADAGDGSAIAKRAGPEVNRLIDEAYPVRLKLFVCSGLLEQQTAPDPALCDRCKAWLPVALGDDARDSAVLSPYAADQMVKSLTASLIKVEGAHQAHSDLQPIYEKARTGEAGPYVRAGKFYIDAAWVARGGGWANTVSDQQWKAFGHQLDLADEALQKAWDLDPTSWEAARTMITVRLGKSDGVDEMEKWYQRAMKINVDDEDTCNSKMYYLYPRWYGSHEKMVAFGHECFKTGNYRGRIAFMLTTAHMAVAAEMPDANQYYAQPEVWKDLHDVYTTALTLYPDSLRLRCIYAKFACYAQRWDEANEQFKIIGDNPVLDAFDGPRSKFDAMRSEAARNSTITQP